ncbi:fluoride efflux transporter CrcB [Fulvivirga sedimenti]|uniref:Fluoride-specific ion channel FluC n=1 Tax=Fulvivirga sedimenti TaxID=2879465 RepID=A0A9X1HQX2_9BACT|nr:fluoride efflux transporter CrcB [Fulvivirga sedimenti]MCA6075482.1 fluoride efflux transporter CrcB [Fulvivirga sedimenti]MCA6076659.1 fluoride efflux transporter CrcB [Fulvivirga sedimenti]MCA6077787.1 fluoride efflux transporter CrcB [Fulvivirga sedimenti]
MIKNLLVVGLGGFAGSICRYLFYIWLEKERNMPLATFTVNMLGSFVLGIFIGYFLIRGAETNIARLFFAVGFCGSFTTFSTFALENWNMFNNQEYLQLAGYTVASFAIGILMIFGGIVIGKAI